jgi:general secretion pathway protein L
MQMEHLLSKVRLALREAAARLGLPAFWHWWSGELAALAPTAPRTALQRRRLRPMVAFENGVAVLWEPRVVDGALVLAEAARVPIDGDPVAVAQAGRAMMASLPRPASGGSTAKVLVALPPSRVLRKQLTLPAAVEEHLRETLAYDLDRHTPFRPEQLYFDAVVTGHDPVNKEISVDWAAALRTVVDAARQHAENWGATVVGVTPEAPRSDSGTFVPPARWSRLNLLPPEARPDVRSWRRPQYLIPASLIAVTAAVAIVLPIWQKRDYVIALNKITEDARVEAAAADTLRQQLDQATGDYNFALTKKYAFPSMVQLLDDVTKILPDDTWLTQLEVKNMTRGKEPHREIVLRGESANAGLLVSALESSKLFEQAAPRSPTTKIQPGPGEVFDLGAQLKPLVPPEPIKLVSVPRAPAAAPVSAPVPPRGSAAGSPAHNAPRNAAPPTEASTRTTGSPDEAPGSAPGAAPPGPAQPGVGAAGGPPAGPGPQVAGPVGGAPPAASAGPRPAPKARAPGPRPANARAAPAPGSPRPAPPGNGSAQPSPDATAPLPAEDEAALPDAADAAPAEVGNPAGVPQGSLVSPPAEPEQ